MDELRRYELYVVFQPELEDEQLEARIDRINGLLTGNDGEIIEVARKGKRRLAYPINKFNQGIDVIYQVNLPTAALETLERQLNLNEDVIRYLVVRRDDLSKAEPAAAAEARAEESTTEEAEAPVETPENEATPAEETGEGETEVEATVGTVEATEE